MINLLIDGVTLKELGERLNLGTGTLTPMIKRMETNGWIKRERIASDERKVAICLQERAINQKDDIHQAITNEVIACQIDLEEYQQLMSQLKILQNKLTIRGNK